MMSDKAGSYPGIRGYARAVMRLQKQAVESQIETLGEIARLMAEVMRQERRIFLFGTGHSHLLAEEAYFRAGGTAAAVPMFHPQVLMLHESAYLSSRLERMPELAAPLLEEYDPQPGELLIVYADSGSNALPVQLAIEARALGVVTVGVCSLQYARIAPLSSAGKKLYEVTDFVLDNGGTPGDALLEVEGLPWRVAPSSTVVGATLWNCLLAEAVTILVRAGEEAPVFASYNMPGAIEHNRQVLEKWSRTNPHLRAQTLKSNR
jgi:uncharacterized phosphosugar-binding protein